jgi:hypothetical protein
MKSGKPCGVAEGLLKNFGRQARTAHAKEHGILHIVSFHSIGES